MFVSAQPNSAQRWAAFPETGRFMSSRNDHADLLERPVRHFPSRSARTRSGHRRRSPVLLLVALIAGGLGAGVISFQGLSPASAEATSVRAAQEALATSDEGRRAHADGLDHRGRGPGAAR